MPKMIHSKYGYEPPEYVQADARLDKWLKQKKEHDRDTQTTQTNQKHGA